MAKGYALPGKVSRIRGRQSSDRGGSRPFGVVSRPIAAAVVQSWSSVVHSRLTVVQSWPPVDHLRLSVVHSRLTASQFNSTGLYFF